MSLFQTKANLLTALFLSPKLYFQDQERQRLHDALEAETIKASVLRHKLLNVPLETEKEIQGRYTFIHCNTVTDQSLLIYC